MCVGRTFLLTTEEAPMSNQTRPDFTTPPHAPQFMGWFAVLASCAPAEARLRRTWAVEPRAVARRCWHWLTTP